MERLPISFFLSDPFSPSFPQKFFLTSFSKRGKHNTDGFLSMAYSFLKSKKKPARTYTHTLRCDHPVHFVRPVKTGPIFKGTIPHASLGPSLCSGASAQALHSSTSLGPAPNYCSVYRNTTADKMRTMNIGAQNHPHLFLLST